MEHISILPQPSWGLGAWEIYAYLSYAYSHPIPVLVQKKCPIDT